MIAGWARAATPCPPPQVSVSGGTSATTDCPNSTGGGYSTDFLGNENPLSEGGVWTNVGLDWTKVQKLSGVAQGTLDGNGGYNDSYAHLSGFAANHTAQATIHLNSALDGSCSHEVELLLRWADAPHNARGYECNLNFQGGCQIVRWNGAIGDFTVLGGGSTSIKNGDVLKASIAGNVITMYLNNSQIARVTDSTFSTGDPGIGFFRRACGSNADFGFTSFSATSG